MAADIHAGRAGMGLRGRPLPTPTPTKPLPDSKRISPSALSHMSDFVKMSRSAGALGNPANAASGSPPDAAPPVSRSTFEAPREPQTQELELMKATPRRLVHGASLFFDILGEGELTGRPFHRGEATLANVLMFILQFSWNHHPCCLAIACHSLQMQPQATAGCATPR